MLRRAAGTAAWLVLGASLATAAAEKVPESLPGAAAFPDGLRAELAAALEARGPGYTPRSRHRHPDGSPVYTNRLLLERSPYLRQHAHNPVDWRPWGDQAFAVARELGRPVLVSIGYSTCHWCHVMEEESFDQVEIARLLNAHFVAIKVDRETRPDVDSIYMSAIHAMGRSGGWPLNVWVTPEGRPFFAGTYFPPEGRAGRPGFPEVLRAIADEYGRDPERIERAAAQLEDAIRQRLAGAVATATRIPEAPILQEAVARTLARMDWSWGGVGEAPKFPSGVPLRLLLRVHRRHGDARALQAATLTLEKMAAGGIHDHVGGGFHRYATDRRWRVPHFEKMLYDNAQLAVVYLEAWQATGRDDFARVTRDVLDYLLREMRAPEGGFRSAIDADSRRPDGEMEEGWFYTWTPDEVTAALGAERARIVNAWFGVAASGALEGRSVLHVARGAETVARSLGIGTPALLRTLGSARSDLLAARQRRPPPLRDDKILAAWNGLAISAFARAGLALAEPAYVEAAAAAADFVLTQLRPDGGLRRVFLDGEAHGPAFLDDYAFLIAGLIDLYEAQPSRRWLGEALALQRVLEADYLDAEGGGYFRTARGHERLLVREKPDLDGAMPSGNSVTALNLLRLADLTFDDSHRARAALLFSALEPRLVAQPAEFGELLLALDYEHDTAKEIVLVSPATGGDDESMLAALRPRFVPNRVLVRVTQGPELDAHASLVPGVKNKRARGGRVTAYVCENRVCDLPTSDPDLFAAQIARVAPRE